ncbi:hypothetical protein [Pleomorphomonas oryzae]|uniref:hypothetical protein n=1 Tax=Pleomorphomonas oryzae TaxID=261934 RepID=UPI00041FA844|nr:hypothetical protein [Pleomorphomonas oryzae]
MISNEWTDLAPALGGTQKSDPVSVTMVKYYGGRARCRLNLSNAMVASIGGVSSNGWVKVRLGYGENAGALLVIGDSAGPFNLRALKARGRKDGKFTGRFMLMLPAVEDFVDVKMAPRPAQHRLEPIGQMKAVIIDLPRAFLASPPGGEKQRRTWK